MNKHLPVLIALLTFGSFGVVGEEIELIKKSCVSDSGMSIYDIEIKGEKNFYGEIRYRFSGQDIFYTTSTNIIEEDKFIGIAEFKSSRSGETKGLSWIYTYNHKDNTLMDNDNVIAKCN